MALNGEQSMKTLATRQDELIEELLRVLRPQLDGQDTVNASQYREMQARLANFVHELMEKPR